MNLFLDDTLRIFYDDLRQSGEKTLLKILLELISLIKSQFTLIEYLNTAVNWLLFIGRRFDYARDLA